MKRLDQVMLALLIFAGVNWGLWGLFEFNLVYYIFGKDWIDRLFYIILGVSGVYYVIGCKSIVSRWSSYKRK